jgi:hypothetical protein
VGGARSRPSPIPSLGAAVAKLGILDEIKGKTRHAADIEKIWF